MKNKKKSVADQIKALEKSIAKFGDSDGKRKAKLAKLQGRNNG